jgi:hypothetical protein
MDLYLVSRCNFGRFMERFSSRGRWKRSRAKLWPKTDPKPKPKSRFEFPNISPTQLGKIARNTRRLICWPIFCPPGAHGKPREPRERIRFDRQCGLHSRSAPETISMSRPCFLRGSFGVFRKQFKPVQTPAPHPARGRVGGYYRSSA